MLDIVVNSLYTNKDVFLREVCMRRSDHYTRWHCDCIDCSFISRFAPHFASPSSHFINNNSSSPMLPMHSTRSASLQ